MTTLQPPRDPRPRSPRSAAAPPLRLADGVELIGEYRDSGFKTPPWIARRSDGQVIQLPRVLYLVAESADGRRGRAAIAERVSHAIRRGVTPEMVDALAETQLRPLGLLASADGTTPPLQKADPLLGLKFRTAVVPARLTRGLTTVFRPLFLTPVVVLVVLGLLALDGWLLGVHGIDPGLRAVIYHPALLLLLLGGVVVATAFHEIGHATACRYGGAEPGVMGVGIYIVWPAFYTDVTDAYRLGKGGRLRTDLGGIYFNAIFALVVAGVWALTRFEPLLLLVLIQNFTMLQQLLPLVRLDGYYVISDLTGVPDMFARIVPVLRSLIPGRPAGERVTELKPWVRVVVTAYVLLVVPLLALSLVLMILHAPRAFATAYDSVGVQWDKVAHAGGVAAGLVGGLQLVALVLPCVGMVITAVRLSRRVSGAAWRWSDGAPARRALVATVGVALVGLAAFTWCPNGDYRPIQPGERGTLRGALASLRAIPTGRPSLSPARAAQLGGAPWERAVLSGQVVRNAAAAGPADGTQDAQSSGQDRAPTPTPDPTAPKGTTPDGTAPDVTTPDGTAPDGTAPDGTAPDGTAPNTATPGSSPTTPPSGTASPAPTSAPATAPAPTPSPTPTTTTAPSAAPTATTTPAATATPSATAAGSTAAPTSTPTATPTTP